MQLSGLRTAATSPETARRDDAWIDQQVDRLLEQRAEVAGSKPDLSGTEAGGWIGGGSGLVLGSMAGAGASMVIEKIPGIPYGRNGYTMAGILLGTSVLIGLGGAIAGTYVGDRLTRPTGVEADRIRARHADDVQLRLAALDRQLEALGSTPATAPTAS